MRSAHFEQLRPVCPVCRASGASHPLVVHRVERVAEGHVLEAVLHCTDGSCRREYPVIDGIPVLVADIRAHVGHNLLHFLARDDLSDTLLGLLGDCAGPQSALQTMRQHQSHYAVDHWSDHDPTRRRSRPSVLDVLDAGLDLTGPVTGEAIDLGCATGRATFELAQHTDGLVLGLDLNFAMLQIAARALRTGRARYPVRRVGMVYDTADHPIDSTGSDRVDFWMADATALPFDDVGAGLVTSLNLIDCTPSPWAHLLELARVLAPGGHGVIATPYDWSEHATPVEQWLGGHSQRGEQEGRPEQILRALIDGTHPGAATDLELVGERDRVPWTVRVHDRSSVTYQTHVLGVRKR